MHIDLSDQYIRRNSLVHRLDPRVKVLLVLTYIVSLGILPDGEWVSFTLHFLLLIIAILFSKVEPLILIRRSFIVVPFVLVAISVLFTSPGEGWVHLPLLNWKITEPGLIRFVSIFFRAWFAVQSAILLTMTTRIPDLFWSLSALKLPSLLVGTISFMYRYLFVLADEALRMMRARSARSPRLADVPKPTLFWEGRVTGAMVGSLFIRSLERSERVYSAMLSRGYDGRVFVLSGPKMRASDWLILMGTLLFLILIQLIIYVG